jgi:hypothetical protein
MPSRDVKLSNRRDTVPLPVPGLACIRRKSGYEYLGMPLWSIALGPDIARGEMRGHARGVIAIGDIATGILAIGGLARGFIAIGGFAAGVISFGGLAIGGLALGGLAIGLAAAGGCALGWVAIGGGAAGYYAAGGVAWGMYAVSAMERSPEAVAFFTQWDVVRMFLPQDVPRR